MQNQQKTYDPDIKKYDGAGALKIKDMPAPERPRERLLQNGAAYLSNAELLAILIGTGAQDNSALLLAEKLLALEKEGGVAKLASCMPEEFARVRGIGKAKACRLSAAVELGKRIATAPRAPQVQISSPQDIAELFMEDMRYEKKEYFKVLHLNTKNEIIMKENVAVGSLDMAVVHPREVFSNALRRSASALVLVHNHPSGNPEPSAQDLRTTAQIVEAGAILGITVLDHLIIGDGIYVSLRERGLME